jgi:hypothetical protein
MRTPRLSFVVLVALVAAVAVAGCGSGPGLTSKEGSPIKLGDLSYNVVITRYLNTNDVEDSAYLKGAPPLPDGAYYLGVFVQVHNSGDSAVSLPQTLSVVDTQGDQYDSVNLKNPYALPLGSRVRANESLPLAESAPANGPIGGSLVLFLLGRKATEDRPLELTVPSDTGDTGRIELDL